MLRKFGLFCFLLCFIGVGLVVVGQDPTDCDANYLIIRQSQIAAQIQEFSLQAQVDPNRALDALYNVTQEYEDLLAECGYYDGLLDFDIDDIGDVAAGEILFEEVYAVLYSDFTFTCANCHSTDSSDTIVGPGFTGIVDVIEEQLSTMSPAQIRAYTSVTANAPLPEQIVGYLYTSIVLPNAYVADGFHADVMPANWSDNLSRQQTLDIIAYLLTLEPSTVDSSR